MGRSIYCSKCKNEKEEGRDNESCCKKCKSEAGKQRRLAKRLAAGLRPLGSGRKPECYDCGEVKENPKAGYCNKCARRRDNEWRLQTGRTKKHQTGLCPCGASRAAYSKSYCRKCLHKQEIAYRDSHPKTEDQIAHQNALARKRYVSRRKPKKQKLDPKLWKKPKSHRNDKITQINGKYVMCSRPLCRNTEGILSNGWCKPCAAAYQRERNKYHEPAERSEAQKIRHRVRALTRSYIKAGKLIKGSCEVCGTNETIEAHHDDYAKPMDIRWLCRKHHREHHQTNNLGEVK